mmetsp:Transcript_107298/g.280209  ORF Transcript_107298/g.280209 Transcript_107298/m.280209 type:complete len:211 (+) Transcript_107298:321-953(+)
MQPAHRRGPRCRSVAHRGPLCCPAGVRGRRQPRGRGRQGARGAQGAAASPAAPARGHGVGLLPLWQRRGVRPAHDRGGPGSRAARRQHLDAAPRDWLGNRCGRRGPLLHPEHPPGWREPREAEGSSHCWPVRGRDDAGGASSPPRRLARGHSSGGRGVAAAGRSGGRLRHHSRGRRRQDWSPGRTHARDARRWYRQPGGGGRLPGPLRSG